MADLVALGAVVAVGGCGGPNIPLRGGRIDATEAGSTGLCEPETDLKTTLREFSDAGFSQKDTISLTACGHTMGGYVHANAFYDLHEPMITISKGFIVLASLMLVCLYHVSKF